MQNPGNPGKQRVEHIGEFYNDDKDQGKQSTAAANIDSGPVGLECGSEIGELISKD